MYEPILAIFDKLLSLDQICFVLLSFNNFIQKNIKSIGKTDICISKMRNKIYIYINVSLDCACLINNMQHLQYIKKETSSSNILRYKSIKRRTE